MSSSSVRSLTSGSGILIAAFSRVCRVPRERTQKRHSLYASRPIRAFCSHAIPAHKNSQSANLKAQQRPSPITKKRDEREPPAKRQLLRAPPCPLTEPHNALLHHIFAFSLKDIFCVVEIQVDIHQNGDDDNFFFLDPTNLAETGGISGRTTLCRSATRNSYIIRSVW